MIILANFASVKLLKSFNEDVRINLPVGRKRGKQGQILCKNITRNKDNVHRSRVIDKKKFKRQIESLQYRTTIDLSGHGFAQKK